MKRTFLKKLLLKNIHWLCGSRENSDVHKISLLISYHPWCNSP